MVPHRMTFDTEGVSGTSIRVYAALRSISKNSPVVKGLKVDEFSKLIGISPATFFRSMNQLEEGNYIVRHSLPSSFIDVEFLPENETVKPEKSANDSLKNEIPPLSNLRVAALKNESTHSQICDTPHPIRRPHGIDKGIDKKSLSTASSINKMDGGEMTDSDRISDWVSERIQRAFPGDECLAETASLQAAGWVRDEGYTPDEVKVVLIEVIGKGIRPIGLMNYTHKVMASNRARASAPPPSLPMAVGDGTVAPPIFDRSEAKRQKFRDGFAAMKARNLKESPDGDGA